MVDRDSPETSVIIGCKNQCRATSKNDYFILSSLTESQGIQN